MRALGSHPGRQQSEARCGAERQDAERAAEQERHDR